LEAVRRRETDLIVLDLALPDLVDIIRRLHPI